MLPKFSITHNVEYIRSRGIWLTALMRGCKLNSLTCVQCGTTALVSCTKYCSQIINNDFKKNMENNKIDYIQKVKEFQEAFNQPIKKEPCIPIDRSDLRLSLLSEELSELYEAVSENDIVGVADALVDIQYVLSGAIIEFGLADKFDQLFNEVHRSNMSKLCDNIQVARDTVEYHKDKYGDSLIILNGKTEKYRVQSLSEGKVLKSVNYSPANLKDILWTTQ